MKFTLLDCVNKIRKQISCNMSCNTRANAGNAPLSAFFLSRISFFSVTSAFSAVSNWTIWNFSCCSWICHFCCCDTSKVLETHEISRCLREWNSHMWNMSLTVNTDMNHQSSSSLPVHQFVVLLLQQVPLLLQLTDQLLHLQENMEENFRLTGKAPEQLCVYPVMFVCLKYLYLLHLCFNWDVFVGVR